MSVMKSILDAAVRQYIQTALWATTNHDSDNPLDKTHSESDLADGEYDAIQDEVTAFFSVPEVAALAEAIAKGKDEQFMDSIGDAFVVLTILAAQKNLEIEECVVHAWHQIKDRKGRMVDGIWIKSDDLT